MIGVLTKSNRSTVTTVTLSRAEVSKIVAVYAVKKYGKGKKIGKVRSEALVSMETLEGERPGLKEHLARFEGYEVEIRHK